MSEPQSETPRSGHPFTDGYFAELFNERNSLRRELDAANELLRSTLRSDMPVVERLRLQLVQLEQDKRRLRNVIELMSPFMLTAVEELCAIYKETNDAELGSGLETLRIAIDAAIKVEGEKV